MYKVIIILLLSVFLSGCSVFRPGLTEKTGVANNSGNDDLLNRLLRQNLTNENFYIQKARIEIFKDGSKDAFLGSVKFLKPDTFLISLRSKSGIEAARIFITGDTLLVNDRLNKQLLYGRPDVLGRSFGLVSELLPMFFGDYIRDENILKEDIKCEEGIIDLYSSLKGVRVSYSVDCKRSKILSVSRESSSGGLGNELSFDKFVRVNSVTYPTLIKFKYDEMSVNIEVEKIEIPWIGDIEFIPGKNFELKELI